MGVRWVMCYSGADLPLFQVHSVAIVGVSEEPGRIGSGLYKSMAESFPGPVYCVNPKYQKIWRQPCYASVMDLPQVPSHAVIAVARKFVLPVIAQCADKGISNVVVISAGFKETDEEGARLEAEMTKLCRERGITLLGPNTLGFIDTSIPYNGTFLPDHYLPGNVSVISQSGGVGIALISALQDQHCGISKWVGIGNEAVVDAVRLLAFLAEDPATTAIGVCFEGLKDLPGFLRLAQKVNRKKPVVILRDGKGSVGMTAAASHTGTMATDTAVMDGLVKQFGLTEARTVRECAAMLKALSMGTPPAGDRVVFLTNTAGPAILAADAMEELGVALPMTSQALRDAADAAVGVRMQLKNPADISSTSLIPDNYGIAARKLLASDEYDILLGFFSLSTHLILPDQQLTEAARYAGKPAVGCFLGTQARFASYDRMPEQYGIPCYCDPNDAAAAVAALVNWGKALRQPAEGSQMLMTDSQKAAVEVYLASLPDGLLTEMQAKTLLKIAGFPVEPPVLTENAGDAVRKADAMGYPVVLKLHSDRISHKSDVGGVRTGLKDAAMLTQAYETMLMDLRKLDPEAKLTVQPMAPDGFEMILGAVCSDQTGPVVMVGQGGIYSELMKDTAFRLVPCSEKQAGAMLDELRCSAVFQKFRGTTLDKARTAELIARLSELVWRFPRIRELEMNPCRIYETDVAVLDARAVLKTL